ncbi:uncharacterized protein TM35_000084080 [Trypanosoma theileri]|uniref:Ubiquitin-like domain-containing protein n=1 Tax=Trypanosoma theileri TaxID=67003 RepID=A0A1X0P2J7_9TRYP|nr:uncharacterized protein TM35_000084080 [Trypanosoma theileri]ORC90610.1 hypothetical protein TM35_000084080 [Trypanosoma theileri]
MATATPDVVSGPLKVNFDSNVELTIHSAFLPTARLLQCDPVAHVTVLTLRKVTTTRSANSVGPSKKDITTTNIVANERQIASTRRLYFTSKPTFNETMRFVLPHNVFQLSPGNNSRTMMTRKSGATISMVGTGNEENEEDGRVVESRVLITLEDAQGNFYGQATCPFSLHTQSNSTEPVRIMLQPRNIHDKHDPFFKSDVATLSQHGVDDFGFVTISWNVSLVPYGGALMTAMPSSVNPPTFPVGLVLRATWLVPGRTYQRGTQYTTSVEFGGLDRFVFDGANPLFLTIQDATQLERAIFHCTLHNLLNHADSRDVAVPLPLPPLASFAMERDVSWAAGVSGLGMLMATVRLVRQPPAAHPPPCPDGRCSRVNDPPHQAACAHVAPDWGRPPPNTPPGAYRPIMWESEAHIARAVQRRWRHDCVVGASPAVEHVRHLLDVLMGRAALDPGVARVVAVFFNQASPTVSQNELKQLLVSCAFHAKGMTPQESARFCFFALRRDMEQAIARDDIVFMLENALIGKTVDMPESEIQRRVTDIFGDTTYVIFDDFLRYFINNYAMWYAFGVPITTGEDWTVGTAGGETSSLEASHLSPSSTLRAEGTTDVARSSLSTAAAANNNNNSTTTAAVSQPTSVAAAAGTGIGGAVATAVHEDSVWRRFVVRVQHSNKAFSVTAHVNDTIAEVMVMVQNSTGIRAACQEWRANGVLLDPKCVLGSTDIGLSKSDETTPEVTIIARDEAVRLVMVYKDKGLRWEIRMSSTEKVLKLRALVQQKTMIPLSRCVLRVHGTCLVDRHQLMYYQLQDGDVVNITQE